MLHPLRLKQHACSESKITVPLLLLMQDILPGKAFHDSVAEQSFNWYVSKAILQDGQHAILTDTRIKVMRAWADVQQDVDRLQASMPFNVPFMRFICHCLAQFLSQACGMCTELHSSEVYFQNAFIRNVSEYRLCNHVAQSQPTGCWILSSFVAHDYLSLLLLTKMLECLYRPRSPDIKASDGQLSIKFQVLDGTDFKWLLSQLLMLLGDQNSSSSVQEGKADVQVSLHPKSSGLTSNIIRCLLTKTVHSSGPLSWEDSTKRGSWNLTYLPSMLYFCSSIANIQPKSQWLKNHCDFACTALRNLSNLETSFFW